MSSLCLHLLNARGALSDLADWLHASLSAAHGKATEVLPLGPLDVVVMEGQRVIPEKGHVGYAPSPGIVFVTIDPGNPAVRANADQSLERMFVHELHHAARWDGPGYGASLGEALVSEGLAGHFVREVYGDVPEPWEALPRSDVVPNVALAQQDWAQTRYRHGDWFFGAGEMPRWLGYSLGFRLVRRHLDAHPQESAASLARAEAEGFRESLDSI
ncbi:MAG: DUF2268 domain-containing putative Zn-dependent protease [Pseudomonadota bacterium]